MRISCVLLRMAHYNWSGISAHLVSKMESIYMGFCHEQIRNTSGLHFGYASSSKCFGMWSYKYSWSILLIGGYRGSEDCSFLHYSYWCSNPPAVPYISAWIVYCHYLFFWLRHVSISLAVPWSTQLSCLRFSLEVFTGIRAYALCNRNIWVLIIVFTLSMVPFATNMVGLHCSEYGLYYLDGVLSWCHNLGIVCRSDSGVLSLAIFWEYMWRMGISIWRGVYRVCVVDCSATVDSELTNDMLTRCRYICGQSHYKRDSNLLHLSIPEWPSPVNCFRSYCAFRNLEKGSWNRAESCPFERSSTS